MNYIALTSFRNFCFILSIILLSSYIFLSSFHGQRDFPDGDNYISFILDVSKSMSVNDVWGRSRLDIAKQKILETIELYPGMQYSLSIFAGESLRVLPFNSDISLFQTFLIDIDSSNISKQGTELDLALEDGFRAFSEDMTGHIVLLTDGDEDTIDLSDILINDLAKQDISVQIVGVGTPEWWYIIEGVDPFGRVLYKSYKWEQVLVKLNSSWLRKLASKLGGKYISWEDMIYLHDSSWIQEYSFSSVRGLLWASFIFWSMFCVLFILPIYQKLW